MERFLQLDYMDQPLTSALEHIKPQEVKIGNYPICLPSYTWIRNPPPQDPLPSGIVFGGKLETGQNCYIGKAKVRDQDPCGFFTDEDRQLHVSYGSTEHVLKDFEILVVHDQNAITWQKCADGRFPDSKNRYCPVKATSSKSSDYYGYRGYPEEMIVGRTCTPLNESSTYDGHLLELSRFASTDQNTCRMNIISLGNQKHAYFNDEYVSSIDQLTRYNTVTKLVSPRTMPGKIHRSHHHLYIPYSGREYLFREHEMLMLKTSPGDLKEICRYVILQSMSPGPTTSSVETLPLPPRLKQYLKKPAAI